MVVTAGKHMAPPGIHFPTARWESPIALLPLFCKFDIHNQCSNIVTFYTHMRPSLYKNLLYFALSLCLKQQLIDLKKEGYSPAFMDQWQPNIKISDW